MSDKVCVDKSVDKRWVDRVNIRVVFEMRQYLGCARGLQSGTTATVWRRYGDCGRHEGT